MLGFKLYPSVLTLPIKRWNMDYMIESGVFGIIAARPVSPLLNCRLITIISIVDRSPL